MFRKSLILFFFATPSVFAGNCKKPENWATANALTAYEACLKKNNSEAQQIPYLPNESGACAILSDGSYRCKPQPLRFFEKSKVGFSLPPSQVGPDTAEPTAPATTSETSAPKNK